MVFTNTKKPRQTASYGKHVKIRGKLVNASRIPIGNARVELLTRDLRRDSKVVLRQALTTKPDGSFSATVAATASRLVQLAWHAYANDASYSANGYLTLRARASASLDVSTHRPRVGRRMTVSGRIHGVGRKGVVVILQGRPRGAKHYTTFADTTASSHGLFKVHYRFRDSGSRGRRFQFRARIRPVGGLPVRDRLLRHGDRARALSARAWRVRRISRRLHRSSLPAADAARILVVRVRWPPPGSGELGPPECVVLPGACADAPK